MPEFAVSWPISGVISRDKSERRLSIWELNDEWSIVCVLETDINLYLKYTSIELHRKNATEEVSINGSLSFHFNNNVLWDRSFRCIIKTGIEKAKIIRDTGGTQFYADGSQIVGHVKISDNSENEESSEKIQLRSLEELSKDLERASIPDSSSFSDVSIKCCGASIPAHKFILSARSPVFARMFANPMKESLTNEVNIHDIDESVLRAMLMYMYTGKTSALTVESAADLLLAAEKYQLQDLKIVCTYFLKNTMSLQDVWRLLVQGDMHSADLKSFAMDYICRKCGEFSNLEKSQEWKDLRKERPDLAMDLLESLVKYRDEKLKP